MPEDVVVTLSLVAHTNVGKTTLARTLLRRDVGEVIDRPHVTSVTASHDLVAAGGVRLVLEDTPGFGDTPRLLRRLKKEGNPIGWFLHTVWDRRRDLPLWCAQEAVRSVESRADVVLYLVNATESPADAAYVRPEMEILSWIGRPVLMLLNQTGTGPDPVLEEAWRKFATAHPLVKDVLSLDAFTRCWVEERVLLERVAALLPAEKRPAMAALTTAWDARNLEVLARCADAMASTLAATAADRAALPPKPHAADRKKAMEALAGRLETATRGLMSTLIAAHGLDGSSASRIEETLEDFVVHGAHEVSATKGAMVGAVLSGALSGLAADLAHGGLTFGGGAVVGAILGALGGAGLAKGFTLIGTRQAPAVAWKPESLARMSRSAMARYLATAHFGRGRGGWKDLDLPSSWDASITETFVPYASRIDLAVRSAAVGGTPASTAAAQATLAVIFEAWARDVLARLYPAAAPWLSQPGLSRLGLSRQAPVGLVSGGAAAGAGGGGGTKGR